MKFLEKYAAGIPFRFQQISKEGAEEKLEKALKNANFTIEDVELLNRMIRDAQLVVKRINQEEKKREMNEVDLDRKSKQISKNFIHSSSTSNIKKLNDQKPSDFRSANFTILVKKYI